jgi:hypothetical protein
MVLLRVGLLIARHKYVDDGPGEGHYNTGLLVCLSEILGLPDVKVPSWGVYIRTE